METINYTIDCWAFFGKVDWAKENVYDYIAAVNRIYALFEIKATRYGFCENPYGIIKGTHGGSAKNVLKKVDDIYSKEAKLKMLEFFSLPRDFNFQQRTVFPNDKALLKSLYLATLQATKRWTQPLRNWGKVYGEFSIMYEDRFPV